MKTESGNIVQDPRHHPPTVVCHPRPQPSSVSNLHIHSAGEVHVFFCITFPHKSCFMSNENSL